MTIGEAILSPALQPLFDKLFSMGADFLFNLLGADVANTIEQWKEQIELIEAVLDDAEQREFSSKAVKRWMQKLQDVAYDMEDILDHFAIQNHEKELKIMNQQDFGFIASTSNMMLSTLFNANNSSIHSKIDDINKRLNSIQSQIQYLRLSGTDMKPQHAISIQAEALRIQRETTCIESEPKIFGRDSNKQEIMAQLLKDDQSNEKNYVVIPIVGKGGVGKTTLAQYVYNDEQVLKDRFHLKAWVCVSDVFDVKQITTSIFNAIATDDQVVSFSNLNKAQKKLKQELIGKRFLIVLDDIWNDNYDLWVKLRTPFQNAAKGSRVIITTRIERIARMMIDESINTTIIKLEGLQDDDCWSLFQQHVYIIKKCKGLPLAVKALGGLLKKTHDKQDRERIILQSETWREENDVLSVLKLSYL